MTLPFEQWYAGKRVFLTGHTGFKGAWLSLWLRDLGAEITGYALPPAPGDLFGALEPTLGIRSIEGDVRDADAVARAVAEAKPDLVIHMAAQSLVRPSYLDPLGTFATNVMGTANLLDAARRTDSVGAVLIVTSDKCYANEGTGAAFVETAPMGGDDPYSASKGCTELVAHAFAHSFFTNAGRTVARARAGNVIGGGDRSVDRLIPDLMRSAERGEPVVIRRPDAVRPWQHVLEPLRGYLMLAHRAATEGGAFADGWNFGPSPADAVPVSAVVQKARGRWPDIRVEMAEEVTGPHEAGLLYLDCGKADRLLGWRPILTLDEGLALTVDWYREAWRNPGAEADLTAAQLQNYRARIGANSPQHHRNGS